MKLSLIANIVPNMGQIATIAVIIFAVIIWWFNRKGGSGRQINYKKPDSSEKKRLKFWSHW